MNTGLQLLQRDTQLCAGVLGLREHAQNIAHVVLQRQPLLAHLLEHLAPAPAAAQALLLLL